MHSGCYSWMRSHIDHSRYLTVRSSCQIEMSQRPGDRAFPLNQRAQSHSPALTALATGQAAISAGWIAVWM